MEQKTKQLQIESSMMQGPGGQHLFSWLFNDMDLAFTPRWSRSPQINKVRFICYQYVQTARFEVEYWWSDIVAAMLRSLCNCVIG
jgi:hypothetical protein